MKTFNGLDLEVATLVPYMGEYPDMGQLYNFIASQDVTVLECKAKYLYVAKISPEINAAINCGEPFPVGWFVIFDECVAFDGDYGWFDCYPTLNSAIAAMAEW